MTHTRTQFVMSFVAGLVLGVAVYHLLPHGVERMNSHESLDVALWWLILGIAATLLLLRAFRFHQHDIGDGACEDDAGRHHAPECGPVGWAGIAIGMGLHALTEGVALGASVRSGWNGNESADLVGFGMFLAIILHKPLDAFSVVGLMRVAGARPRLGMAVNVGLALLCPVYALLTFWGLGSLGEAQDDVIGRLLAFAAGGLVCISLSDLLPELQFHRHDRFLLSLAFLLGIGLAYALHYLEEVPLHAMFLPPSARQFS